MRDSCSRSPSTSLLKRLTNIQHKRRESALQKQNDARHDRLEKKRQLTLQHLLQGQPLEVRIVHKQCFCLGVHVPPGFAFLVPTGQARLAWWHTAVKQPEQTLQALVWSNAQQENVPTVMREWFQSSVCTHFEPVLEEAHLHGVFLFPLSCILNASISCHQQNSFRSSHNSLATASCRCGGTVTLSASAHVALLVVVTLHMTASCGMQLHGC
jgi:hypothetical protein